MTKSILLLTLILSGCASDTTQWDFGTRPDAVLEDGTRDPRWTEMVTQARMKWSDPLVARGCPDPFRGSQTHPVILVPSADWKIPGVIGSDYSSRIEIMGTVDDMLRTSAYETVLPHELGHAIGLPHVDDDNEDPLSLMHPSGGAKVPSPTDLDNAAAILGC